MAGRPPVGRTSVSAAVNPDRLWHRHLAIARIGATGRGGVNRQALTPEDAEARRQVLAWAAARGFTASVDAIGNLFVRRAGSDPAAAPVVSGSHLDTQPTGGNFDGIFGVLAALEVLDAAEEAHIQTRRPLDLVIWTNEEGARFQPTTMGSAVFAGALPLAAALDTLDGRGVSVKAALAEALAAAPVPDRRPFGFPVAAYLEAHIEQGPILEATGMTIGVVTGIQGLRWYRVEVTGEEAHAGTMPLAQRRDALLAAMEMVQGLRELMADPSDTVRFTVGRFEVQPNSPNTVCGRALFTIDFRHPHPQVLARLGDRVEAVCRAHARGCAVEVAETLHSPPTAFSPVVAGLIRAAAERHSLPYVDIVSGATHDAKHLAGLCPTGMIFVPCARGISHNEAERASPADLAAGTRVLADVVVELANT